VIQRRGVTSRWLNSHAELLKQAVAVGGEDVLEGAGGGDASGFEEDDVGGDAPDFSEIVRDIEDARWEGQQAREDVLRRGVVECGQRLVEEKQIGSGREGAGEGDALALSAGKLRSAAIGERFCAEEMQHFEDAAVAGFATEMADAEGDVVARGEVGEKRGLLRDESDGAAAGRDGDAVIGVEEGAAGERDAAVLRHDEAGEDAKDGALAGAGGSEEDGPAGVERELGVEGKVALTVADADVRHGLLPHWLGARRAG
jgi:hypothetical protein